MDQAVVCAELQRVFALHPGKVVDEIVHRNTEQRGGVFRRQRADSHKVRERVVSGADVIQRLPYETVAEVVDQSAAYSPGMPDCHAFGSTHE